VAIAQQLEPTLSHSPLAAARVQKQLTAEEAAERSGLSQEQVTWLEEGRVYRFPSSDDALVAVLLYSTAIGIDRRQARELAGLPVPPLGLDVNPVARMIGAAAMAALVTALGATLLAPHLFTRTAGKAPAPSGPPLSPPWKIRIDVLNGNGDINYTRRVASKIGAIGYRITHVTRANRFDYPQTAVYYERGGGGIAVRLARQLGVVTRPLPGGNDPRRLVVIVGPAKGPG
jgi:LytR cell envelope-related transcriptional attenuator/helix-turn-helix protein